MDLQAVPPVLQVVIVQQSHLVVLVQHPVAFLVLSFNAHDYVEVPVPEGQPRGVLPAVVGKYLILHLLEQLEVDVADVLCVLVHLPSDEDVDELLVDEEPLVGVEGHLAGGHA